MLHGSMYMDIQIGKDVIVYCYIQLLVDISCRHENPTDVNRDVLKINWLNVLVSYV